MQEEPHFVSRPHFSGVYDEGWNHGAPPISFGTHEEKIFEDFISASFNHDNTLELFDDLTISGNTSPRFDEEGASNCNFTFPHFNHPKDACLMSSYQPELYDPNFSAYHQVGPQLSFQEFPSQNFDRFSSFQHPGYRLDSDSDSGIHSPPSITSPSGEMRNWPLKAENVDRQVYLPAPEYTQGAFPEAQIAQSHPQICDNGSNFFNMDDQHHYTLDPLVPIEPYLMDAPNYLLRQDQIKSEPSVENRWSAPQVPPSQRAMAGKHRLNFIAEPHKAKITKRNPKKKRRRGNDREKCVHLWEFIRDILLEPQHCPSLMKWEDRGTGVFRFVKSDTVASMWGKKKQNPKMTYEKLSRAMRYYYNRGILERVDGRRLVYKFGPNSHGWKSPQVSTVQRDNGTSSSNKDAKISDTSCASDVTAPCPHKNNAASNDVMTTSPTLLPSADVLLGKPNSHPNV